MKTNLKTRLKGIVQEVSADPFGIETKLKKNLLGWFEHQSLKRNVPLKRLSVQFNYSPFTVKLLSGSHVLEKLDPVEFSAVLLGQMIGLIAGAKVIGHIDSFMTGYAWEHGLDEENLKLFLSPEDDTICIMADNSSTPVGRIPIKRLIEFFSL